jgi:hypothetical protein
MDLAEAMIWPWVLTGNNAEAGTWLGFVLEGAGDSGQESDQRALLSAARMLAVFDRPDSSVDETFPQAAMALAQRLSAVNPGERPIAVFFQAILTLLAGGRPLEGPALERALASADPWIRGTVRMVRASLNENDGAVEAMRDDVKVAMTEFEKVGDRWGLSATLSAVGQLRTFDGDLDGAIEAFRRAGGYLSEIGAVTDSRMVHLRLSDLYLRKGDLDRARRHADLAERGAQQRGSVQSDQARSDQAPGDQAQSSLPEQMLTEIGRFGIARAENDRPALLALRDRLAVGVASLATGHPFRGHGRAIGATLVADIGLRVGDLDDVPAQLADAYASAIDTHDRPILALVGITVACLAEQVGEAEDAAEILGACARLRGADDPTDLAVSELRERLIPVLGDRYDAAYRRGRALDPDTAVRRLDPEPYARRL